MREGRGRARLLSCRPNTTRRMPNPPPEVLQELEEIGAVEVVKDEEGGSWEEVGE